MQDALQVRGRWFVELYAMCGIDVVEGVPETGWEQQAEASSDGRIRYYLCTAGIFPTELCKCSCLHTINLSHNALNGKSSVGVAGECMVSV